MITKREDIVNKRNNFYRRIFNFSELDSEGEEWKVGD